MTARLLAGAVVLLVSSLGVRAATRLLVTVIEEKSAAPVVDLKAGDFAVTDGSRERRVEAAEYSSDPVDAMMLVDTSLLGRDVQPVAADLIGQMQEKEEMALVAYHSSADLIQEFTASKDRLLGALSEVKYGNQPRALDAIYAAVDGGFEFAVKRRVIILITAGLEGSSRVGEKEVIRLARRKGVSIYPVYLSDVERGLFRDLAAQTGGAPMNIQRMSKELKDTGGPAPAERVMEAVRGHYVLTLAGNLALGDKLKVEIGRDRKVKVLVSALPLE